MALKLLAEVSPQELLVALAELQNHVLGYVKSMSLKCAIHRRGGTATLADIAADTKVHPARLADLRRVMELLSSSGIFSATAGATDGTAAEVKYGLTTACRLLVGWRNLSPVVPFCVNPLVVSSFGMPNWLRRQPAPGAAGSHFELAHGCSQPEMASKDSGFNHVLNDAMTTDSEVFLGLSSLVDVGGGNDAGTRVIAKAFPRIKCTVLDLPHVVGQAAGDHGNLRFVAGDMFESIPPADIVLLKILSTDSAVVEQNLKQRANPAESDSRNPLPKSKSKAEAAHDVLSKI